MEFVEADFNDSPEMREDFDGEFLPIYPQDNVKVELKEGVKQEVEG